MAWKTVYPKVVTGTDETRSSVDTTFYELMDNRVNKKIDPVVAITFTKIWQLSMSGLFRLMGLLNGDLHESYCPVGAKICVGSDAPL